MPTYTTDNEGNLLEVLTTSEELTRYHATLADLEELEVQMRQFINPLMIPIRAALIEYDKLNVSFLRVLFPQFFPSKSFTEGVSWGKDPIERSVRCVVSTRTVKLTFRVRLRARHHISIEAEADNVKLVHKLLKDLVREYFHPRRDVPFTLGYP